MSLEPKEPQDVANEYLRKHHITELFEDLCTAICFKQPEDVEQFIVEQLKLKKSQGYMTGIFAPQEIKNVFELIDLRNSGFITKEQCKDALKSLASSEYQFGHIESRIEEIPDKVNFDQFQKLCQSILGIKE